MTHPMWAKPEICSPFLCLLPCNMVRSTVPIPDLSDRNLDHRYHRFQSENQGIFSVVFLALKFMKIMAKHMDHMNHLVILRQLWTTANIRGAKVQPSCKSSKPQWIWYMIYSHVINPDAVDYWWVLLWMEVLGHSSKQRLNIILPAIKHDLPENPWKSSMYTSMIFLHMASCENRAPLKPSRT